MWVGREFEFYILHVVARGPEFVSHFPSRDMLHGTCYMGQVTRDMGHEP